MMKTNKTSDDPEINEKLLVDERRMKIRQV